MQRTHSYVMDLDERAYLRDLKMIENLEERLQSFQDSGNARITA